jgi:hypothetical protein
MKTKATNILYRKVLGVELGTVLLVLLAVFLIDPGLYLSAAAVVLALGAAAAGNRLRGWWRRRGSRGKGGHRTLEVSSPDAQTQRGAAAATAAAGPQAPAPAAAASSSKVFGKRKVQLAGVRVIEGRVELFHILIQTDHDSWLVWRSKEQIFDLRKKLVNAVPDVSVPQLPSVLSSALGGGGGAAAEEAPRQTRAEEEAAAVVLRRHQSLVCAWLQVLNDTPVLRDRAELAAFLDDISVRVEAGPSPLPRPLSAGRGPGPGPGSPGQRPASLAESSPTAAAQPASARPPRPQHNGEPSTMKRIKALFGGGHGHGHGGGGRKGSGIDVPPGLALGSDMPRSDSNGNGSGSGEGRVAREEPDWDALMEPEGERGRGREGEGGEADTYEAWLAGRQRALGFSGDSFETFEFTDVSAAARALFKDTGEIDIDRYR